MDQDQLIKQLKRGDASAQRTFYDRFAPRLYAVCLRYMPDDMQAQDSLQEAFILIFRNMDGLKETSALEGWVRKIAVNTCLMALRRIRKDVRLDAIAGVDVEADGNDAVSDMAEEELMSLVRQLPDGLREVFNLFAIDGYGHGEIATMLGITESNSKVRLNRARRLLREKLEKMGITAHSG